VPKRHFERELRNVSRTRQSYEESGKTISPAQGQIRVSHGGTAEMGKPVVESEAEVKNAHGTAITTPTTQSGSFATSPVVRMGRELVNRTLDSARGHALELPFWPSLPLCGAALMAGNSNP